MVSAPLKAAGSRQVVSRYVRTLYDVLHISDSCQEQVREPAAIKVEDTGRRDPAQSRDNARATARRHLDLARDIDYQGSRPNGKNGT